MSVSQLNVLLAIALVGCTGVVAWSPFHHTHMANDNSVIVQMFEWRFDDIADECERFLGPEGFGGVQVSPVNEHAIVDRPWFRPEVRRPWWEIYQPISYKIETRIGNATQMRQMVERCNRAGVRIYVDIVLNHMTGVVGKGHGMAGSWYDSNEKQYDGVPFTSQNFNSKEKCGSRSGGIEDWNRAWQIRNCELVGLHDLDQSQEYVRNKQRDNLNQMIDMGVAGFRVDASKHMWPADLKIIFDSLNNLNTSHFRVGSKAFFFHEVTQSSGEITVDEYAGLGRVMEFRYMDNMQDVIRKRNNQQLRYLQNFGTGWNFLPNDHAVTVIDNHDIQRGDNGNFEKRITYRHSRMLKMATAFMLAWPYGLPKLMSSYDWPEYIKDGKDENNWIGPPHNTTDFTITRVKVNADGSCSNGWICEHRWRQIANMVEFRNVAENEPMVDWWDNGKDQIAFSRRRRAFVAINNEDYPLNQQIQTAMPSGVYCDVISGQMKGKAQSCHLPIVLYLVLFVFNRVLDGDCTGRKIYVDDDSKITLEVRHDWADPIVAIHVHAKLS